MKKKILITLASLASLTTGITAPLMLSSCSNGKLKITMEGSKWGYIISDVKPYYEYTLTLSNGFKKGDLVEMEIVNPSVGEKIKLENDSKTIEGDDINSMIVKVLPYNPSTEQEQFSVNFSLKLVVKRESKKIYSTQIDSLILDAVLPATDPDYFTYDPTDSTKLTGINLDKHDELVKKGCLVIPWTVKSIASKAFSIPAKPDQRLLDIYNSNKWILLDYSIYDSSKQCALEEIQSNAFFNNKYFKESLYIPSSVTAINDAAFMNCSGFSEIKFALDSKITTISQNAFTNCLGVSAPLVLPKNQTFTTLSPGLLATNDETGIPCESITIPNNVVNTSDHASFFGLNNLKIIDLSDFGTVPKWNYDPFYNPVKPMPSHGTIYINNENLVDEWKKIFQKSNLINWDYIVKK